MSRKRTHEQMSAGENEMITEAKLTIPYKRLLQSLEQVDSVVVKSTLFPRTWTVSRSLLCNASKMAERVLQDRAIKSFAVPMLPDRLELFIQWLYFGTYQEHDGYAPGFSVSYDHLAVEHSRTSSNMNWSMKAAMLAHNLGRYMEAFKFQDYAMAKLVQVYGIAESRVMITPDVLAHATWSPKLKMFYEDALVRNWGDKSVVDHEHGVWSKVFERKELKEKLVQAMATPLEERRREPMVLRSTWWKRSEHGTQHDGKRFNGRRPGWIIRGSGLKEMAERFSAVRLWCEEPRGWHPVLRSFSEDF